MNWQQAQQRNHQACEEAGAEACEERLGESGLLQPGEEPSEVPDCSPFTAARLPPGTSGPGSSQHWEDEIQRL